MYADKELFNTAMYHVLHYAASLLLRVKDVYGIFGPINASYHMTEDD